MDESRIVVTGATGQLGTALQPLIPKAVFLRRADLDLRSTAAIEATVADLEPDVVINCAAYTAVDAAEADEEAAAAVNGTAVGALARACERVGGSLVTFSTDYVFDGSARRPYVESDPTAPINAYGRSKVLGEELALMSDNALVIRTSWVVSGTHHNFVSAILAKAAGCAPGDTFGVVDDQIGVPTLAPQLAAWTLEQIAASRRGILHAAGQPVTNWYALARRVVGEAGFDKEVVAPVSSSTMSFEAKRPAYSVLGTEMADLARLASWDDGIEAVVVEQLERIGD